MKAFFLLAVVGLLLAACQPTPVPPPSLTLTVTETTAQTLPATLEPARTVAASSSTPAAPTRAPENLGPTVTAIRVVINTPRATLSPTPTAPPACPGSLPYRLAAGQPAMVSLDPPVSNRVRSAPDTSAEILGQIQPGEKFSVLEGPQCAGGLTWWRISSLAQTLQGWTVEGDPQGYFLTPLTTPTP